MPKISVIVPVYKVEKYLDRCISSILAQTYTDFELILIDDGSPDNCPELCDEYAKKDERIIVIHQENGGLSAARNTGIDWVFANSDSEWITFVDSDDWVHRRYLEAMYNAVERYNVDISICGFIRTEKEVDFAFDELSYKEYTPEDFWVKDRPNATVAWGKLYKRYLFEQRRYPVGKLHEDEFVTYKLLFLQSKVAVIEDALYFYFQNTAGIMKQNWNLKRLDGIKAINEQIAFFEQEKFLDAAKSSAAIHIPDLVYTLIQLDMHYPGDDNKTCLVKELRYLIRKYKRALNLHLDRNSAMYKYAFPKRYKFFLFFRKKNKHLKALYKSGGIKGLWNKFVKK